MQVESTKTFQTGFVLKETDLRRIIDIIQEQFSKLASNLKSEGVFRVKLRNGALVEAHSLDEVLSLENGGSNQITRLEYKHHAHFEGVDTSTSIEFVDIDSNDEAGYTSIRFQVHGSNRDWVFVTSSQLEERCERVRRFALNQLLGKGPIGVIFRLLAPLIMLLVALMTIGSVDGRSHIGELLEKAIKSGEIKEPIDAILFVQKQQDALKSIPRKFIVGLVVVCFVIIVGFIFLVRYYPVYNFCWGEYADEFQRKESRRQFWLVIIIIGVIVSFLGGILANNIGLFKQWFGV